jgi:hypothetical protein
LQRFLGTRDEPLWRVIRRNFYGEKFTDKVEDHEYEYVDFDALRDEQSRGEERDMKFECVELPYTQDATERERLRLRNGRVTITESGRLKTVNVGFASERSDGSPLLTATPWSRDEDMNLLLTFNKCHGDQQQTVEHFLHTAPNKTLLEVKRRLTFLLSLINIVKGTSS